jgi:hypothetical protein
MRLVPDCSRSQQGMRFARRCLHMLHRQLSPAACSMQMKSCSVARCGRTPPHHDHSAPLSMFIKTCMLLDEEDLCALPRVLLVLRTQLAGGNGQHIGRIHTVGQRLRLARLHKQQQAPVARLLVHLRNCVRNVLQGRLPLLQSQEPIASGNSPSAVHSVGIWVACPLALQTCLCRKEAIDLARKPRSSGMWVATATSLPQTGVYKGTLLHKRTLRRAPAP